LRAGAAKLIQRKVDAAPTWTSSARKVLAVTTGSMLLAVGLALLVLPGPGIPLILAGLGILSVHYSWARKLRTRISAQTRRIFERLRRRGERAQ
jgi:Putative transmembrane protein (PGPGW)